MYFALQELKSVFLENRNYSIFIFVLIAGITHTKCRFMGCLFVPDIVLSVFMYFHWFSKQTCLGNIIIPIYQFGKLRPEKWLKDIFSYTV